MSTFSSVQTILKATAASVVGATSLTAGLLWYGQGYLLYPSSFPAGSRTVVVNPGQIGIPYEDLTLETVDNVKIRCYLIMYHASHFEPPATAELDEEIAKRRPTVIMFHGNGGNMGHRLPLAIEFLGMRCNVMMVSYRGYGLSEGTPSEKGFCIDAQTALDFIVSNPVLGPSIDKEHRPKIILYGQSIGGAVAIDLAARNPQTISGIILENTFLSIPRLIPTAVPYLAPFSFLCHQRWDSENAITKLPPSMALLMLSGLRDQIVPASHMKELWEIAQKRGLRNATWGEFPTGTHNDTHLKPGYWDAIAKFIDGISSSDVTKELEEKKDSEFRL